MSEGEDMQRHVDALAREIAFGELGGTFLVIGAPPEPLLQALAAAASGISLFASHRRVKEVRRSLEQASPLWVAPLVRGGDGLPEIESTHHHALIWDLPKKDPQGVLERTLFAVADAGRVFVSIPRSGGADHRLERLLRSLCGGEAERPEHAPSGRLVLRAERRAPYPAESLEEVPGPLPVSVIIPTLGRTPELESLLLDVFLRQNLPPAEAFILDDDPAALESGDTELFGIPDQSPVRAILVPTGGIGRSAAINDALGGIESPFVAILDTGCRIAPNHLAALGMALESDPELLAVVGAGWSVAAGEGYRCRPRPLANGSPQLLRGILAGTLPPLGAALFRTEALREMEGFDPDLLHLADRDLWHRLAARGSIGVVPLPLAMTPEPADREPPEAERRHLWATICREISLARLAMEFTDHPKEARRAAALACRAEAAGHLGLLDAARADFEAALESSPSCVEAQDGLFLTLLREGADHAALELAQRSRDARPDDPAPALATAIATARLGSRDAALSLLDDLQARDPELEAVPLVRLLLLAPPEGPAAQAIRDYVAWRCRRASLPLADIVAELV